jgi:transposase
MTKTQVEVITSVQRRRIWSRAAKERIVGAAREPCAVASEIAPSVYEEAVSPESTKDSVRYQ